MSILLHFFVEAKDAKGAKSVVRNVLKTVQAVEPGCRSKGSSLKPYWKIAGWYDAGIELSVPRGKDARVVERALAGSLADGWRWLPNGFNAVCTDDKGRGSFKVPNIRWAEIDLDPEPVA